MRVGFQVFDFLFGYPETYPWTGMPSPYQILVACNLKNLENLVELGQEGKGSVL